MNDQKPLTQNKKYDNDEIDLSEIIFTLLDNKLRIFIFTFIATCFAFIYAYGKSPIYEADTLLQVEKKKAITGIEDITGLGGLGGDNATVDTEIELIKSRRNLQGAIKNLNLDISAYPNRLPFVGNLYKKIFSPEDIKKLPKTKLKWLDQQLESYAWGAEEIHVSRLEVSQDFINKKLSLIILDDKDSFSISYEDKLLLKGKVGKFSSSKNGEVKVNISLLTGKPGTKFTIKKYSNLSAIVSLQKRIKASEKGKKTGILKLSLEGKSKKLIKSILDEISQTYIAQNKSRSAKEASNALEFLKGQIKPVEEKAKTTEAKLKTYRTRNQTVDISREAKTVLDVISGIDTELQKLSLQRDDLGRKYTTNHPVLQSIAQQEKKLRRRKKKTLAKISKLPETQQTLITLERDYKVANAVYLDMLNKIQEFKIAKASTVGNVYIIDPAAASDSPIKPKKRLILAIGALLGFMIAVILVFLRKALQHSVTNPDLLEEAFDIPVYATVPLTKNVSLTGGLKKNKKQKSLLALEKPDDPSIESLRSLRTSLHFALLEAKNNIVMITGPTPGIGKTFISSNFSAVLAATAEQKVLLIDADMRKGYLHNLFNKNISPGLSELISHEATLNEATHTIQVGDNSNLDIITRGQTPPNPSELLMHSNFKKFLDEVSTQYDLVLIDTPPVNLVTDPVIIGGHSGVVFMVVFSDHHNIKEIEHAVTRLSNNEIKTKGFIFNGVLSKKSKYGYGYGYGGYYGEYKSDH